MKTPICALAAVLAFGASATPAIAAEEAPSIRVGYADLDLSKAAGRATLEDRVNRAVRRLCTSNSTVSVAEMQQHRTCRKEAWTGARIQLAAIYAQDRYADRGVLVRAAF